MVIDFTERFIGRLATSSGETILPFFRTSLSIDNKSTSHDFDPVTEADRAAEAVMRRLIKANFPQHASSARNSAANAKTRICSGAGSDRRHQILYRGLPDLGTLIATAPGHAVFGMMHQPFIGERFFRRQRSASTRAIGDGNWQCRGAHP